MREAPSCQPVVERGPGRRKLAQTSLRASPKNASLVEIGFGERGNWKLLVSAYNKLTFCWKFSNKLSWEYFWIQRRILFLELFCLLNSWGIFCSTKRTQKWKLYASKTCEMIQQQAISKFWKRTVLETVLHSSNVMMVAMKENSGRQTQFVENSHRGEDILNFIATILRYNPKINISDNFNYLEEM